MDPSLLDVLAPSDDALAGDAMPLDPDQSLLLSPGHPAVLQTRPGDPGCRVTMLGVKPGEFLMVKPPAATLARIGASDGQTVRLSLENEGVICQMDIPILHAVKHPLPLLFLGWPGSFQARSLRRHPRLKCLIPTLVEANGTCFQAHILDISLGGCRLVADLGLAPKAGELKQGQVCEVGLALNGPRLERLAGQVRARALGNGEVSVGLSFSPGDLTRSRVSRFVDNLQTLEDLRRQTAPAKRAGGTTAHIPDACMAEATACVQDARQIELKALSALDIQFTGCHLFDQSMILGVDGAETVIAEMPISCGLKNCPKPGMGLRARFQDHGSYYGFMTSVTKFLTRPRPLVLFAYPKKIETLMRRKHPRVRCQIPTSIANEHFRARGFVTDVSVGGCRVLANLDASEPICNVMSGDVVQLTLPLGGPSSETLRAKVKSFTFAGGPVTMGLVFALDKKQVQRLDDFVARMESASR